LIHHKLALENREIEGLRGLEKCVREACQSRLVHQQDCAALGVELPLALKDGILISSIVSGSPMRMATRQKKKNSRLESLLSRVGPGIHLPYFVRRYLEKIDIGRLHGKILLGDLFGASVIVYVPLDRQLSRLSVDGTKITDLFCGR
jgi:hypothetical protein